MMLIHALQVLFWVAAALAASVAKGPHKVATPLELEELAPSLTQQEIQFLEGDPIITHKIVFSISQKGESIEQLGDLSIGLFGTVVPNTVENFVHLSNMTYGFGYQDSIFHRVIKNFMIQGGDFEHSRGTGGYSIFDKGKFPDENFELKHRKLGRLSMANSGPNTNGAQFFVTNIENCDWLDGKHVVFGQVIGGFDTLHRISSVPTAAHNRPAQDIVISSISVIPLSKIAREGQTVAEPVQHISPQETPVFVVEKEGTGFYVYFFVVLLVGGCIFYYNHWYHKKQYITDIKDSAYF